MKKFIFAFLMAFTLLMPTAFAEEIAAPEEAVIEDAVVEATAAEETAAESWILCELETRAFTINGYGGNDGGLPNLRYNGVSYFPLDERNQALLGVSITDSERALSVEKLEEGKYTTVPSVSTVADMSARVTVVDKFVIVNGRLHDNAASMYPFLKFNDVYYMPVYWQYIRSDMGWSVKTETDEISLTADNSFVVPDGGQSGLSVLTGDYCTIGGGDGIKIVVSDASNGKSGALYIREDGEYKEFDDNAFDSYDCDDIALSGGVLEINARHSDETEDEKYRLTIDVDDAEISDIYYYGKVERSVYPFETDGDGNFLNEITADYAYYEGSHVILNGTMIRSYCIGVTETAENGDSASFESSYWVMVSDLLDCGYDALGDTENRTTYFTKNDDKAIAPPDFAGTDERLAVYPSTWKIVIDGKEPKLVFNVDGRALVYCGELGNAERLEYDKNYFVMNVSSAAAQAEDEIITDRVIGYYSVDVFDEPVSELQTEYLTDVIYAFVIPKADGSLFVPRTEVLAELVKQAKADGCRVYAAIGGGGGDGENILLNFETVAADEELTRKFVENCVWMLREYDLDGIEIDWESPTNATKDSYEAFMAALCGDDRIGSVSIAVSGSSADYPNSNAQAVTDAVLDEVDFIDIMAYGIYGNDHSPYSYAVSSLDYWSGRGVEKHKLILGVPLFALPGYEQYRYLAEQGYDVLHTEYFEDLQTHFNSRDILVQKAELAKERGGGIMFFDIHEDAKDEKSASKAVYEVMTK